MVTYSLYNTSRIVHVDYLPYECIRFLRAVKAFVAGGAIANATLAHFKATVFSMLFSQANPIYSKVKTRLKRVRSHTLSPKRGEDTCIV